MVIFTKALFLATTFPKIVKNSIFDWIFIYNFQSFLYNFPHSCVFRPDTRKFNAVFLIFLKNRLSLCIFRFSKEIFCKFSKFFCRPRAAPPSVIFRGRPPKVLPPTRNPGGSADRAEWMLILGIKQHCDISLNIIKTTSLPYPIYHWVCSHLFAWNFKKDQLLATINYLPFYFLAKLTLSFIGYVRRKLINNARMQENIFFSKKIENANKSDYDSRFLRQLTLTSFKKKISYDIRYFYSHA